MRKNNGASFDTKNVTKIMVNSSLMLKDAFRTIQNCFDVKNFGLIFAIFSHCASSISASILCDLIDY